MRFKNGLRNAIAALLAAYDFLDTSVVVRPTPSAEGLTPPSVVIAPARGTRRPSPAGNRVRELAAIVAVYFSGNSGGAIEQDTQEQVVAVISAALDIPTTMPAGLTALVPELQELRVRQADTYMPSAWRYLVGGHRIAVVGEVCQLAGVA